VRAGAFMKRHMKETNRTAKNRWKPQIAIGFSDDFFSSKKPTTMLVFQRKKFVCLFRRIESMTPAQNQGRNEVAGSLQDI